MDTDKMLNAMFKKLKELPDGAETTTLRLAGAAGFPLDARNDFEALFELHTALIACAKRRGFVLDLSKHRNKVEGLPFNLDFVVRRKTPAAKTE